MRITNLLYLAHGEAAIRRQAVFSLLTLFRRLRGDFHGLRVVVATDAPGFFRRWLPGVPLVVDPLGPELLQILKGESDYLHRIKAQALRRAMHTFDGDLVMVDTDTWYERDPRPLFARIDAAHSLMHAPEYPLAELARYEQPLLRSIPPAFEARPFEIEGQPFPVRSSTVSWNSGVIGIAEENRHLTDRIVALLDQMRARVRNEVVEQYAVSAVLGRYTTLRPAEAYVRHYWERPAKSDYDHAIHGFLRRQLLWNWSSRRRRDLAVMGEAALALVEGDVPPRPAAPTRLPLRALAKLGRTLDAHVLGV
jgi:hypothetical protein